MPDTTPKATTRKRKPAKARAKAAPARGKARTARKTATTAKRKATATSKAKAGSARKATGAKRKAASKASASASARGGSARARRGRGSPAALSRDALRSLEEGQRAALDAVRKFVETVDSALPLRGDGGPRRQEIVDSALEMAERLVQTQYDLLRKVVQSAGRPFGDARKRG
jgi:hypothetical protein